MLEVQEALEEAKAAGLTDGRSAARREERLEDRRKAGEDAPIATHAEWDARWTPARTVGALAPSAAPGCPRVPPHRIDDLQALGEDEGPCRASSAVTRDL
jgi:hypothetical protein